MKEKLGLCALRSRLRTIYKVINDKRDMFISVIGRFLFQINATDFWEVILKILTAGQFFAFFTRVIFFYFVYKTSIAIT